MKRQEDVERLKAAMDEAHETALREKYSRRMQHLEQGGHDTTQLKAHLAGNRTNLTNQIHPLCSSTSQITDSATLALFALRYVFFTSTLQSLT